MAFDDTAPAPVAAPPPSAENDGTEESLLERRKLRTQRSSMKDIQVKPP